MLNMKVKLPIGISTTHFENYNLTGLSILKQLSCKSYHFDAFHYVLLLLIFSSLSNYFAHFVTMIHS